jgi:hypothetical protein
MMARGTEHPTGYALLHNPRSNKGTAFTAAERRAYGLEGLLPPAVTNIELQVARRHAEIANLDDDLQKYLVLTDLQMWGGDRSVLVPRRCSRTCSLPKTNGRHLVSLQSRLAARLTVLAASWCRHSIHNPCFSCQSSIDNSG